MVFDVPSCNDCSKRGFSIGNVVEDEKAVYESINMSGKVKYFIGKYYGGGGDGGLKPS